MSSIILDYISITLHYIILLDKGGERDGGVGEIIKYGGKQQATTTYCTQLLHEPPVDQCDELVDNQTLDGLVL